MVGSEFHEIDFEVVCDGLRRCGDLLALNQGNGEWSEVIEPQSLKTVADLLMHEYLMDLLSSFSPQTPIFSEEVSHNINERPTCYWLIDPIDGTASWLDGFDGYVSQIALINDCEPVFAAIYHPKSGRLWHVDVGIGCCCNGSLMSQPIKSTPPWRLIDNYPTPRGIASRFMCEDEIGQYVESGSLGLKAILTLSGEAELFIKETKFRDWDLAPAICMSKYLNGHIVDFSGEVLPIGRDIEFGGGLIVSNSRHIVSWAASRLIHNN